MNSAHTTPPAQSVPLTPTTPLQRASQTQNCGDFGTQNWDELETVHEDLFKLTTNFQASLTVKLRAMEINVGIIKKEVDANKRQAIANHANHEDRIAYLEQQSRMRMPGSGGKEEGLEMEIDVGNDVEQIRSNSASGVTETSISRTPFRFGSTSGTGNNSPLSAATTAFTATGKNTNEHNPFTPARNKRKPKSELTPQEITKTLRERRSRRKSLYKKTGMKNGSTAQYNKRARRGTLGRGKKKISADTVPKPNANLPFNIKF